MNVMNLNIAQATRRGRVVQAAQNLFLQIYLYTLNKYISYIHMNTNTIGMLFEYCFFLTIL